MSYHTSKNGKTNATAISNVGVLLCERRHFSKAMRICKNINKEENVQIFLFVVGEDIWDLVNEREIPSYVKVHRISLYLDEKGDAERLASEFTKQVFSSIDENNEVFSFQNEVYINLFVPAFKVIVSLKHFFSKYDKTWKLFLIGGNRYGDYLPVFFAEGERPFTLLHHRSWLINPFVFYAFRHIVDLTWYQTPKLIVQIIGWVRRQIILAIRIWGVLRNYIVSAKQKNTRLKNISRWDNKSLVPFIVRSWAQFDATKRLLAFLKRESRHIYPIFVVDHTNLNQDFLKNPWEGIPSIVAASYIPWKNFLLILIKSFITVIRSSNVIVESKNCSDGIFRSTIDTLPVRINLRALIAELRPLLPDYLYRKEGMLRVLRYLDKYYRISSVVTTELISYGGRVHKEAALSANLNLPLIVLQGVVLLVLPYPSLWGDVYLLSSPGFYKFAINHYKRKKFYHVGNFRTCISRNAAVKRTGKFAPNIVIFTQPDMFERLFRRLIIYVLEYIQDERKQESLTVLVKPHPRDRQVEWYNALSQEYPFFHVVSEEVLELCLNASVVVTATSSVIFDALAAQVPIISFLEGYTDHVPEHVRDKRIRIAFDKESFFRILTNLMSSDFGRVIYNDRYSLEGSEYKSCMRIQGLLERVKNENI